MVFLFLGKSLLISIFLFTCSQRKGTEDKGEREGGRRQDDSTQRLFLSIVKVQLKLFSFDVAS